MTKNILLIALLFLYSTGHAGLLIVDNHRSTYMIIIPARPAIQETRAADLLQRYILQTTNCKLPIVKSNAITSEDAVVIKSSHLVANQDGFTIQSVGNQLFITGGEDKGCIYGVVELLEHYLGCRKYAVDFDVIPKTDYIYLPDISISRAPANTIRLVNGQFCQNEDYRDWHRLDVINDLFAEGYYVHTFQRLIPWQEYFDEHPEYFALMNGKRIIDQPCLSNPEVLKITLDKLRQEMILQPDKNLWSVSQNDNFSYCRCDDCQKTIEEEQSPAGPVIRFVNAVADTFPDKTISTLAYQYSRKAPVKTKPRKNVQVMLCTIELNRSQPIRDDPTSLSFMKDMEDWGKICNHIYLWDYTVNFSHHISPFPNLHILQPNIRLFTENNIREHFQQSNTGNGHEFSELKSCLISGLLWDPDINVDSVFTDFLTGYYGDAGPWIQTYINHLLMEMAKSGERLDIYEHPTAHQYRMLSLRNANQYNHYFDQAEKAVKHDPTLLLHVKTARLPLQYAMMEIGKNDMFGPRGWYIKHGDEFILRNEMAAIPEQFIQTCREAHVKNINEAGLTPGEYYKATMRFIDVNVKGNKAFRKQVTAEPLPAEKYSGGDLVVLTNGVNGASDFKAHWLGWEGENFTLVVDLEQIQPVNTIRISTLYNPKSWIFHPSVVACSVSEDGNTYLKIGEQKVEGDQKDEEVAKTFLFTMAESGIRFIRFQVSGLLHNPDWHSSAGGDCWVFVDEIVVE